MPALNLLTGNETFLTISKTMLEPWATFLIGAAILLLSQVVLSYGMRFYLTLNKWVFILAMASTVFLIVVLAMSTREQFVANLNELVGPSLGVPDAYNAIIASGKEKGWGEAGFDLWQTMLMSNWPFLPLIGAAFSIAIGGEIKSVGKIADRRHAGRGVGRHGGVGSSRSGSPIGCSASSSSARRYSTCSPPMAA